MTSLNKFALLAIAISLAVGTSLNSPYLSAQETVDNTIVKHKVIQLKRNADATSKIEIEDNGKVQIIELKASDLEDEVLLESKLANLDDDTRTMVLEALGSSKKRFTNGFAVIDTQGSQDMSFNVRSLEDIDIEIEDVKMGGTREMIVVNRGDAVFKGVLKGHHNAIINLIEKGEFTRDELNEIRKALDAKF